MVNLTYDYEWDAHKAASNLKKHGVTFEQAASVFLDALALTVFDAAHSEHEERWFTLGYTTRRAVGSGTHLSGNQFKQYAHPHYFSTSGHKTGTTFLCG
ncbi:MAG: BrnT family toxin [Candidatus Nitrotoga sp.]